MTKPEAVILIGIQASGKSTFWREQYRDTHVRINLDMLKTRKREEAFLEACYRTSQSFVVDQMNLTREIRARYIERAKASGFTVVGYCFKRDLKQSLLLNSARVGKARVPEVAIRGAMYKLELPSYSEGFDSLWFVTPGSLAEEFLVEAWKEKSPCSSAS